MIQNWSKPQSEFFSAVLTGALWAEILQYSWLVIFKGLSEHFKMLFLTHSTRYGTFFKWKVLIVFLFLHENVWCGYSLEAHWWGASNEYPQHMFSSRNKKNVIWIPPLIWHYAVPQHIWFAELRKKYIEQPYFTNKYVIWLLKLEIYGKCGKESNFSYFPQYFVTCY